MGRYPCSVPTEVIVLFVLPDSAGRFCDAVDDRRCHEGRVRSSLVAVPLPRVDTQAGAGAEHGDHDAQHEREGVAGVQSAGCGPGDAGDGDEENDQQRAQD